MTDWKYPTAFSKWGEHERSAIRRVVSSGKFTMGPEVEAFEEAFAVYHGRRFAIMVNSGSSANLVAVAAFVANGQVKPGQAAVVPAIAWSTTYAPLVQHGLDLHLVDCDGSWNADVYSKRFDPPNNTGLVVGCSILGMPADLESLRSVAAIHDAAFLEDNCESLGARHHTGPLCGTFGDLATFSFFYSHQISGIEGGMILTDDETLAALCRMLRAHGWTRDVKAPQTFEQEYDFRLMGYNVRPLEMHAAVAHEQMKKLPEFIKARRDNVRTFEGLAARLLEAGVIRLQSETSREPSPFGIAFEVIGQAQRSEIAKQLRAEGIDCRLPTGGSFRLHPYGERWRSQETPIADRVHNRGMFLGNAPWDIEPLMAEAVKVMEGVLL